MAKVILLLRIYSVVAELPSGADGGPVLLQFYIGKHPCKAHLTATIEDILVALICGKSILFFLF